MPPLSPDEAVTLVVTPVTPVTSAVTPEAVTPKAVTAGFGVFSAETAVLGDNSGFVSRFSRKLRRWTRRKHMTIESTPPERETQTHGRFSPPFSFRRVERKSWRVRIRGSVKTVEQSACLSVSSRSSISSGSPGSLLAPWSDLTVALRKRERRSLCSANSDCILPISRKTSNSSLWSPLWRNGNKAKHFSGSESLSNQPLCTSARVNLCAKLSQDFKFSSGP
mmetsp:Transcript_6018/g.9266  ORF Transcript_6018/g.9266 Transcript_6018/m.9266 type:complete len:222 (-) Transcript_6018:373-1038(-)